MKTAWACLFALASSACTAQPSHVELAHQLYRGCVVGTLTSKTPPETQKALTEMIEEVDAWCMEWMAAWYVVGVSDDEDPELNFAELRRFNEQRNLIKGQIQDELKQYIKKK